MSRLLTLAALLMIGGTSIAVAALQAPAQRPTAQALAATSIEKVRVDRNNGGSGLEYAATVGKALGTVKDVDTLIVGHSPLRTTQKAGKSAEDAAASIDLSAKYKDYKNERYTAAVRAIYDELTQ